MELPGFDNADEFERSLVAPASVAVAGDDSVVDVELDDDSESVTRARSTGQQDSYRGKLLGHYRLMRVVGGGAMGVVFQAEDVNLKRIVALKVLRKRIVGVDEGDRIDLFLREARAVASLDHPNIVQIHQINNVDGWWYIAMEYIEGGTLDEAVKQTGPLELSRACMLLADAADGLIEAHEVGIVHRDVKPANLMITRRGRCKVTDFGLVKIEEEADPFHENKKFVGTPLYMAPEIIRKSGAYPVSDVYSLAATTFFVLGGQAPFSGSDWQEVLRHHLQTQAPDIRQIAPSVSSELADLLNRCMAKTPDDRPSMSVLATAFRTEVAAASVNASMHSSTMNFPAPDSATRMPTAGSTTAGGDVEGGKNRLLLILAVALLAGVLLGGMPFVYKAITEQSPTQPQNTPPVAKVETPERPSDTDPGPTTPTEPVSALTRADVIPVKAEAEAIWSRIQDIDRGQGFAEPLNEASVLMTKATAFFDDGDLDRALPVYESLVEKVKAIDGREQARAQARSLMDQVAQTRGSAVALDAATHAADAIGKGDRKLAEANQAFDAGRFDEAQTLFAQAGQAFENAGRVAGQWDQFSQVRQQWSDALAKRDLAEVREHGGDAWDEIVDLIREADAVQDPTIGVEKYRAALAALPELDQTVSAAIAQEREQREARIAALMRRAREHDDFKQGRVALAALDEVLAIDANYQPAAELRNKIRDYYDFKPGETIENGVGMKLAFIPAGQFTMGSPAREPGRDDDEVTHTVKLTKPVFMATTEITQAQWKRVMGADYKSPDGEHPNDRTGDRFIGDDLPADGVSWNEAVDFCRRLSKLEGVTYRLPTEAEWEYAARAGSRTPFSTGETLTSAEANIDGTITYNGGPAGKFRGETTKAATFRPNAWGLYDMHGNVLEWVADWYSAYPKEKVTDPTGPKNVGREDQATKVIRGGSWRHPAKFARSANRMNQLPVLKTNYIGFRVVMEFEPID